MQDFLSRNPGQQQGERVKTEQARTHLFILFSYCNLFLVRQKVRWIQLHLPGKGELELLWWSIKFHPKGIFKRHKVWRGCLPCLRAIWWEIIPFVGTNLNMQLHFGGGELWFSFLHHLPYSTKWKPESQLFVTILPWNVLVMELIQDSNSDDTEYLSLLLLVSKDLWKCAFMSSGCCFFSR